MHITSPTKADIKKLCGAGSRIVYYQLGPKHHKEQKHKSAGIILKIKP